MADRVKWLLIRGNLLFALQIEHLLQNTGVLGRVDQLIPTTRIPRDVPRANLGYALAHLWGNMKVRTILAAFALSAVMSASAQVHFAPISINGRIPLGIESFRLDPAKQDFYLMASAETPAFVGLRRVINGTSTLRLISRNGKTLTSYPDHVQFRLTASAREKMLEDHPFGTKSNLPMLDLLASLKFRLKVFHGLAYRYIQPASVDDVGMPRNLPYNERIYSIGFNLGHIPIEDRVVMEVITPTGERLCKFHLDLL